MRLFVRFATAIAVAAAVIAVSAIPDRADARNARVSIEVFKAGFIIGASGGDGTMTYGGRRYRLDIGGVSIGATIGVSKARLSGTAYNLRRPSDIEGTYVAAQAGLAAGSVGDKVFELKNSKGVVLRLSGRQIGLEVSLDLNGMVIALD